MGVSLPLRWRGKQREGWIRVAFRRGRFSNPEETLLGEGLEGVLRVGGRNLGVEGGDFKAELSVSGGELLLDRWYLKLEPPPLRIHTQGKWRKGRGVQDFQLELDWGDSLRLSVEGALENFGDGPVGRIHFILGVPSLSSLFQHHLLPSLTDLDPRWVDARVEGTVRCEGEVRLNGRNGGVLRGEWNMEGVSFATPDGPELAGVSGRIPFLLPLGEVGKGKAPTLAEALDGEIRIERIEVGGQRWEDIRLPLRARWNALEIRNAVEIPLFGGMVRMEGVHLGPFLPLPPDGTGRLLLKGIRLEEITRDLPTGAVKGTIQGEIVPWVLKDGDLQSRGELRVSLWGGEVRVLRLWGERLFSERRRLGMDLEIHHLDLEEATQQLPFGRMGGVLEGEVRDLVFSFGQPESFELRVRSVHEKGVRQYIDAKAVENFSILSSGVRTPLLPWFKIYPYSRLGIYCKLENDVFILRGTIQEGGKEYLIKRGWLRGINVINRNPQNRIPWRDMLRRIQRMFAGEGQKVRIQMGGAP
jgi:hypothetical protein